MTDYKLKCDFGYVESRRSAMGDTLIIKLARAVYKVLLLHYYVLFLFVTIVSNVKLLCSMSVRMGKTDHDDLFVADTVTGTNGGSSQLCKNTDCTIDLCECNSLSCNETECSGFFSPDTATALKENEFFFNSIILNSTDFSLFPVVSKCDECARITMT